MLRFIIKWQRYDNVSNVSASGHYTLDADVPELEAQLTRGGYGESGGEFYQLIDAEILRETTKHKERE